MARPRSAATTPCVDRRLALILGAALALAGPAAGQDAAPDSAARPTVSLAGIVQTDARLYPGDDSGTATDAFRLRRARLKVDGRLGRLEAVAEVDLGRGRTEITDGWLGVDVGRGLYARAGRFMTPFGLESLRSSSVLLFAERGLPTALSPRRDLGVMVDASWFRGRLALAAGVFNGAPGGEHESGERSEAKDLVGRVFVRPSGLLNGLGVGVAVSEGTERGTPGDPALPVVETMGDRLVFEARGEAVADGRRRRIAPQADLTVGPFGGFVEWTWAEQRARTEAGETAVLRQQAWQVLAMWSVTGEPQTREGLRPRRPLGAGGIGAVEAGVRVHGLRVADGAFPALAEADVQAASVTAWGLALNWAPVDGARLSASVDRTALRTVGGEALPAETVAVVRAQLRFASSRL